MDEISGMVAELCEIVMSYPPTYFKYGNSANSVLGVG